MKINSIKILLLFISCSISAYSQPENSSKIWTLKECINHALENNISIKKSELEKVNKQQDVRQAKGNFLPNLNASASQNYNFGSSIDVTNNRVSADYRSNNYSLNSNWVLFDGFANIHTLNRAKINIAIQEANIVKMKNDISLNVVNNYLQVLFAKEQIKIANFQVNISEKELERITALVEAGAVPKGDMLNAKATLSTDIQTLTEAQNNFEMATLRLAQLLLIPEGTIQIEEIQVAEPTNTMASNSSTVIYDKAVGFFPEIKAAQLVIQSADKSISISKADYLPTLSFNYSLSTAYQHRQGFPDYYSYNKQLDNNLGHVLGLTLSIPIFNRFQFRSAVSRAEINKEQATFDLESEKIKLRESVQLAYTDASTAAKSYEAAKNSVDAQREAFDYANEKFQVGSISSYDFNQSKNRLFSSETQLIRSKYDYTFKVKVLEFYYGVPIISE
ncbi:MAG: TolC family protein [Flavobacteriales bacterium]|nr:TolC family protein [Flavobacteriales bacterium]